MTTIQHDLSVDQPTAPVSAAVADCAADALLAGQTHYVDVGGVSPLVERLRATLAEQAGTDAPAVLVTAGIQEARFLAIQVVGERLGGVALPSVVDPGVRRAVAVRALPATVMPAVAEHGFLPMPTAIADALGAGTRLVYLESPSRLTGAAYDAQTAAEIAALIVAHDATVIWDQGLAPWVHRRAYAPMLAQTGMAERAIMLGEAWPGVGLESWFVGYLAASPATVDLIRAYKQIISICTSTAAQYAAVAAAKTYPEQHRRQVDLLAESYETGLDRARALGLSVVEGATASLLTIAVADVPGALARLAEAGIVVTDGADFGAPGLLRLAATTDDGLLRAIERLAGVEIAGTSSNA